MTELAARLDALAATAATQTYGDLARDLGLRMGALTAALECLMAEDAAAGHPLRAALCRARLGDGLPAPGFFQLAERLGRDISDPGAMVAQERAALYHRAQTLTEKNQDA